MCKHNVIQSQTPAKYTINFHVQHSIVRTITIITEYMIQLQSDNLKHSSVNKYAETEFLLISYTITFHKVQ